MYSRYGKTSARHAQKYAELFISGLDAKTARRLYDERIRLFEILDVSLDLGIYLLVLSLRATSKIDQRAHLHVEQDLVGYGRAAMQEMLVIRLRELFHAVKDKPEEFRFNGFHQTLCKLGKPYPKPNLETNNAIARIIKRRNFYSAHHHDGKKEYSYEKNRLRSLDLITALSYISKVEESRHGLKDFDPFERLLNEELGVDSILALCGVYEVVTGQSYEVFNPALTSPPLPNGLKMTFGPPPDDVELLDGDYEDTPEFLAYEHKAKKELQRIRLRVNKIIN